MRKNKAQSFTIIRKNGRPYMTHTSRNVSLNCIPRLLKEWISYLKGYISRVQGVWTGNGGKDYVALSTGRLHGGMQMGRQ